MSTNLKLIKHLLIVIKRFINEKYTYRASALAFTTLLSIVPLLVVMVYTFSFFPMFATITNAGKDYILNSFVPASATNVSFYLQAFTKQAKQLPTISILFLFVTAILLINTVDETLNDIWQAPPRKRVYLSYMVYCAILLFLPLIAGSTVSLLTFIVSFSYSNFIIKWLMHLVLFILPVIINTFIFTLLYRLVPNVKVTLYKAFSGAFIAATTLETLRLAFTFYISSFTNYAFIYGVFATIPMFLVWLYIFWFTIIAAALLISS